MSRIDKVIRAKLQKQIDNTHTMCCKRIDADPSLTPIKKKYLKKTSYKLCKHEILVEHNRILDLHQMISEDIASRKLRDIPLPPKNICKCDVGNIYCFCVNSKNKWLIK